jgi:Protein of unknown function (DUF3592)
MPVPDSQVSWMLSNREKILRYAFIPQFLVAAVLLAVAHFTGHTDLHLLLRGARTSGKIVGFQQRQLHTHRNPSSTGMYGRNVYLPIVEFEAQGAIVRFEEKKLITQGEGVGWPVTVLYDPASPSVARIDRAFWNWMPWAPLLAIGILLALAALKGLLAFLSQPQPAKSVP